MIQFIFIRHARSIQNKSLGPSQWIISAKGEDEIQNLSNEPEIQKIELLFCSAEKKAQLTAQGLVTALQKDSFPAILIDKRLNEVDRDKGVFYATEDDFKQVVKRGFQEKDISIGGWEPATQALERISAFMNELEQKEELKDKIVGIVSHGTILNLYFSKKGGYYDNANLLYKKWGQTAFCGWGKIVNNKIIRELL